MAQKTIKLSELNELKQACADNREDADYYYGAWHKKLYEVVAATVRNQDLKNKLWAAEQEIHDLKYDLEREQNENDLATDHWAERVAEQNEEIHELSNRYIDLVLRDIQPINPPACLKPLDAMKWTASCVYSGPGQPTFNTSEPLPPTIYPVGTFGY